MKINVLPQSIANMIAAGEVVERPASVVKELAENSVDAGAKSITIEIKKGGMSYIRITDDGCGIAPEEVVTAFKRHATSKIKTEEDLNAIYTLGFRGEALASIAAVAKVDIFTKPREEAFGYAASIEGGEVTDCGEAGCPDGTTMTVRELFYNTPARMKFLKSDATETSYVTDVVHKLILSYPSVAFKLIVNGKITITSPGDGKLQSGIRAVFGKDYIQHMKEVDYSDEGIKVTGFVGTNALARKDRRQQVFFINGRYVHSKIISSALSEAYQNVMMVGKFPVAVIFLNVSASFVDVNVHPTKIEVRFSDDKKVYSSVYWAVRNTLSAEKYIPEITSTASQRNIEELKLRSDISKKKNESQQVNINFLKDTYIKSLGKSDVEVPEQKAAPVIPDSKLSRKPEKTDAKTPPIPSKDIGEVIDEKMHSGSFFDINDIKDLRESPSDTQDKNAAVNKADIDTLASLGMPDKIPADVSDAYDKPADTAADTEKSRDIRDEFELPAITKSEIKYKADRDFTIVGQIFGTYIIVQKDDKMLIIDQHAAHERIYFEELVEEYRSKDIKKQILLAPETMDMDPVQFELVLENMDLLSSLGFECEEFGESSIIIRTAPGAAIYDIRSTVGEIINLISKGNIDIRKSLMEDILHTMACKRAIKGNTRLDKKEMAALCERVLSFDSINTCPHGRPIMTSMSKYEMEKNFKRIV